MLCLKVIWCPSSKRCYLPAKAFHETEYRCLVDQYYRSSTHEYRLGAPSIDLVSFLKQQGFVVSFLPDRLFEQKIIGKDCSEQSTNSVLLVSPTGFKYNTGAAKDNAFMSGGDQSEARNLRNIVLTEFQGLFRTMTEESKIKVWKESSMNKDLHFRLVYSNMIQSWTPLMLCFRTTGSVLIKPKTPSILTVLYSIL